VRCRHAVALGLLADRVIGDERLQPHPTAVFGRFRNSIERRLYADSRRRGAAHTAIGVACGTGAGTVIRSPALATMVAVGGRSLADAATAVGAALQRGDLARARALLPALVGRDPSALDEKEVCRAVVESVAENTVDAVVAPALWAAAAGAPGALAYRAVNTMDAMVGYKTDRYARYGWAAARLDDLAGWLPARATAVLVASARPACAAAVWRTVRRDAPAHPSPNSGVAEAAFAAALGLRLGGESRYGDHLEVRPPLGDGRPPETMDIRRAAALSRDVTLLLEALLATPGRKR
jgi:adenosylcobinamide-phosphate synthase